LLNPSRDAPGVAVVYDDIFSLLTIPIFEEVCGVVAVMLSCFLLLKCFTGGSAMTFLRNALVVLFVIAFLIGAGVSGAWVLGQTIQETEMKPLIIGVSGLVFSLALVLAAFTVYVNHGFGYQGDIIRRVITKQPLIAITFDDGPSPQFTPQILDVLKAHDVQASFFVVGKYVKEYPEIVLRMYNEGHDIGNHTYDHINVPTSAAPILSSQLVASNIEIMKVTGEHPLYARPPRGMYDARFRRLVELMGMQTVLWSISSQDWRGAVSPRRMTKRVVSRAKPGDIILFHDGGSLVRGEGASRQRTVDALPGIIAELKAQGFRIVPLSRLLRLPHAEK
jgi:peptidoglycan/xylan/chitin deacetylase (PgdA/CDA1 family)